MSKCKIPTKRIFHPEKVQEHQLFPKGDLQNAFTIDLSNLKQMVSLMKRNAQLRVFELEGNILDTFNTLVSYIQKTYGTPEYNVIYNCVREQFNDLSDIIAGTVGGYFAGCFVKSQNDKKLGCSATCANSMPPPVASQKWQPCEYTVIHAYDREGNVIFPDIRSSPTYSKSDNEKAVIYLHGEFRGLTSSEKQELEQMGIKEIEIYTYDPETKKYIQQTDGFVPVSAVKERIIIEKMSHHVTEAPIKKENNIIAYMKANPLVTIGIVIVIILILALLLK